MDKHRIKNHSRDHGIMNMLNDIGITSNYSCIFHLKNLSQATEIDKIIKSRATSKLSRNVYP